MAQRRATTWHKGGLLAIGGTAVAGLVLSVAPSYACSDLATFKAFPSTGTPGTAFSVRGEQFTAEGEVALKWGGSNARVLRTTTTDAAGNLVESLTVPADAQATSYLLSAIHTDKVGKTRTYSISFKVTPPAVGPVIPEGPAEEVDQAEVSDAEGAAPAEPAAPTNGGLPSARPNPVAPSKRPTVAPAPSVARRAAAPAVAPAAPAVAPTAPDEVPATPTPAADAGPLPSPIAEVGAVAGDLWSGLSAERKPSLLEEAPGSAGQRTGSPLAILLLGSGLAAMAGTALAAGRRRLVHAVASIRR